VPAPRGRQGPSWCPVKTALGEPTSRSQLEVPPSSSGPDTDEACFVSLNHPSQLPLLCTFQRWGPPPLPPQYAKRGPTAGVALCTAGLQFCGSNNAEGRHSMTDVIKQLHCMRCRKRSEIAAVTPELPDGTHGKTPDTPHPNLPDQ